MRNATSVVPASVARPINKVTYEWTGLETFNGHVSKLHDI